MPNISTGESSQLVKLSIAPVPASGDPAYVELSNVTNISITGQERATVDVTVLRSLSKEYVGGFLESGNISFDIFVNPADAGYLAIRDHFTNNTRFMLLVDMSEMQVQGDPADWQFGFEMTAFVTNPGDITFGMDQAISGTVNCKITGNVDIVPIT